MSNNNNNDGGSSDTPERLCVTCNVFKPESEFFASSIRAHQYYCRVCTMHRNNAAARQRRQTSLAYRLLTSVRRRAKKLAMRCKLREPQVQRLLDQVFRHRSIVSGNDETDKLSLAVWNPHRNDRVVDEKNVICLTMSEAVKHQRALLEHTVSEIYPQAFVQEFEQTLQTPNADALGTATTTTSTAAAAGAGDTVLDATTSPLRIFRQKYGGLPAWVRRRF